MNYCIIEGSPSYVSVTCDKMYSDNWECNGELVLVKLNDRVVAFQGMVIRRNINKDSN